MSFIHIYHLVKCFVQFRELTDQVAGIYRQGFWCLKKCTSRWNYRQRHCRRQCSCVLNDDWSQHQNRVKRVKPRKKLKKKKKKNYVEIVKESVLKRSRSFMCNETIQVIDTNTNTLTHLKTSTRTAVCKSLCWTCLSLTLFYHWFCIEQKK